MKKVITVVGVLLFTPTISKSQVDFGINLMYSTQFKQGCGIEIGSYFNNKVYMTGDFSIYPGNNSNNRVAPTSLQLTTGIKLNNIQLFITGSHLSTGHESISENEGYSTFSYGGGISYILWQIHSKVSLSTRIYNIDLQVNPDVHNILKNGHYNDYYITYSLGLFGKENDDEN